MIKVRSSPDFAGMTIEEALADMKERIANYEAMYEPIIEDEGLSYVKLYNLSSKILAHRVYGRFTTSMLPYMASLHVGSRPIWLIRSGISTMNNQYPNCLVSEPSTVDLDASLDGNGTKFAKSLAAWIKTAYWLYKSHSDFESKLSNGDADGDFDIFEGKDLVDDFPEGLPNGIQQYAFNSNKMRVYSSTLKRAREMSDIIGAEIDTDIEATPLLNPVNKGKVTGLSRVEIMEKYPHFYQRWSHNKFEERFPGGESYSDIISKLEHFVISVEQETKPVLIISHVSCIQILLAYYLNVSVTRSMEIEVPMHTVIELQPTSGINHAR